MPFLGKGKKGAIYMVNIQQRSKMCHLYGFFPKWLEYAFNIVPSQTWPKYTIYTVPNLKEPKYASSNIFCS